MQIQRDVNDIVGSSSYVSIVEMRAYLRAAEHLSPSVPVARD